MTSHILETKDTTYNTARSASYLDIHLEMDREDMLKTKQYDIKDYFNFPIVNFPFLLSIISAAPANGAYICQLILYTVHNECNLLKLLPLFLRSVVYVPSKIIELFGPPTFGYEWT